VKVRVGIDIARRAGASGGLRGRDGTIMWLVCRRCTQTASASGRTHRTARLARWSSARPGSLELLRQARDAAAVASAAGRRRMDLTASWSGAAAARPGGPAANRPPGSGEPALRLSPHQGRSPAPQGAGLGIRDPNYPPPSWTRPRPASHNHDLVGVPAPAGRWDRRLRLLHIDTISLRRLCFLLRDHDAKFTRGRPCGTLDPDGARRVCGLTADRRARPPRTGPSGLPPALQRASAAPGARAAAAGSSRRTTLTGKDQPPQVHRRNLLGGLVHEYRRAA
jgi:hypothetical protein